MPVLDLTLGNGVSADRATSILTRRHWIFDMDGTLTHAIHDFDAIRETLGLPAGKPILESIDQLPAEQGAETREALDRLELDIAEHASAQPGSHALLEALIRTGCRVGILTRNGRRIADATLQAAGLDHCFEAEDIVSRDCCEAKPSPAGVLLLLQRWHADAADTVMVGDYHFDLAAGRAAGTATIHLDVEARFDWPELTDIGVSDLTSLCPATSA